MQGRGNRAGRGNYSSRHTPNDAGSSRNVLSLKENEINKGADDGVIPPAPQDKKNKEASVVASSPVAARKISTVPVVHDINRSEVKIPTADLGDLSALDPILMPSQDSRLPVGTIRREVGSQRTPVDQVKETHVEIKIKTACWMANVAAYSSVQAGVVSATSLAGPPNQGNGSDGFYHR